MRANEEELVGRVESGDGSTDIELVASVAPWSEEALFKSANAAREAIASGHVVWDGEAEGTLEGVELRSTGGSSQGLQVRRLRSQWFEDPDRFPPGTATLDCAIVVRDADHEWHAPASEQAGALATAPSSSLPVPAP